MARAGRCSPSAYSAATPSGLHGVSALHSYADCDAASSRPSCFDDAVQLVLGIAGSRSTVHSSSPRVNRPPANADQRLSAAGVASRSPRRRLSRSHRPRAGERQASSSALTSSRSFENRSRRSASRPRTAPRLVHVQLGLRASEQRGRDVASRASRSSARARLQRLRFGRRGSGPVVGVARHRLSGPSSRSTAPGMARSERLYTSGRCHVPRGPSSRSSAACVSRIRACTSCGGAPRLPEAERRIICASVRPGHTSVTTTAIGSEDHPLALRSSSPIASAAASDKGGPRIPLPSTTGSRAERALAATNRRFARAPAR